MIDHFLDIYSNLVIGVISFIAPVSSYLLSTYLTDRKTILKRLEEQIKSIDIVLANDIKDGVKDGKGARKTLEEWNKKLKNDEEEIAKKSELLNYLEPKKRISNLFLALFSSICLLLLDSLVRGNFLKLYNHCLSSILILASIILFACAIFSLSQIAWKLIEAKDIILNELNEINESKKSVSVTVSNVTIKDTVEAEPIEIIND